MSLDLSATVTQLLKNLASETYVKIIKKSGGTFDPIAGETTGETETSTNLVAAVTNIADNLIDGERIKAGDKQVIFDNAVAPEMDDLIEFESKQYRIVMIDGFNHAGTQQFWKVICRG